MTHLYRTPGVPPNLVASFERTLRKGVPPSADESPYTLYLDRPQYISTQVVRRALGMDDGDDADAGDAGNEGSAE